MVKQDDIEHLIEQAKRGDPAAFEQLVTAYRGRLEKLIDARLGARLRGSLEVDDVLQETLLRAYRSIDGCRGQTEDALFSWLSGIVAHVIQTAAEKNRRNPHLQLDREPPGSHDPPSRAMQREERFDRLRASLRSLSPDHREVIILARIDRLRIKEIAERMGRSPQAVKKLLARALRKLRESFGDTESLHLPERSLGGNESDGGD